MSRFPKKVEQAIGSSVSVTQVANGWMVRPDEGFRRDQLVRNDDLFTFNSFGELCDHLAKLFGVEGD